MRRAELTPTMRKALQDFAQFNKSSAALRTLGSLAKRGLIARGTPTGGYVITDAGRSALGVDLPDGAKR